MHHLDMPDTLKKELAEARENARTSKCEDQVQYNLGIIRGIRSAVIEMNLEKERNES